MNYLISVWSYIFEERILDRILAKRQKIHLHSFADDTDLVSEWSESYPNTSSESPDWYGLLTLVRSRLYDLFP